MPRKYKRKTDRSGISETDMEKAKKDVHESKILAHQAAKNHGINVNTPRSRLEKNKSLTNLPVSSKYTVKQAFTIEQERELAEYAIKCANLHYGLTLMQLRRLFYEFAVKLDAKYPASWDLSSN